MPEGVRTARPPSTPVPTSPWTGSRWLRPSPAMVVLVLPGSEKASDQDRTKCLWTAVASVTG